MWELEHPKQEKMKERLIKADKEAKESEGLKHTTGSSLGANSKMTSSMANTYKSAGKKTNDEILEFFKAQSQPGKNMSLQQRAE